MSYAKSTNLVIKTDPTHSNRPIRILQVVGGMDRGGTETWLMHVLRHIDRNRFHMDFLVYTDQQYVYTDEVQSLGSQIFVCSEPSKPLLFATNFKKIVCDYGQYDIIHVHVHFFSGYVLHLARQAGIKARIVHSHTNTSSIDSNVDWKRKIYVELMKWWINKNATAGLAASRMAAASLFGSSWANDSRWQTLYCGIDLAPFHEHIETANLRAKFGIPHDAFVIGHVGRFNEPKNHHFLLEIVAKIATIEPNMRLVLIGVGPLRAEIEVKVIQMNLSHLIIFLGGRSDIPQLMIGLMDVFLFPSIYEGLGLVLVEAQAAGIPCIFSDVIPEEADIVKPLIQRVSLTESADKWAEIVLATRHQNQQKIISENKALDLVATSAFNIQIGLQKLTQFYNNAVNF
jgi:glycosyltransferase involved in cell wall biosynthesis